MPKILTTNFKSVQGTTQASDYFPNGADRILSVPRIIQYSVIQEDDGNTPGETFEIVTRGETKWLASYNPNDFIPQLPSQYSKWFLYDTITNIDSPTGTLTIDAIYSYSSTPIFTFGSYDYASTLSDTLYSAGIGGAQCYYIIYGSDNNVYGLTSNWNNCCPVEIGGFCASTDGLTLYKYSPFYYDDNWGNTVSQIFGNGDETAISQLPFGVSTVQELGDYIYNHLS